MILSNKTIFELIRLTDKFDHPEINRLMTLLQVSPLNPMKKVTVKAKSTEIFLHLKYTRGKGPFTDNIHYDFLQYLIDDFFIKRPAYERGLVEYNGNRPSIRFENAFSENNPEIANGLRRDGYVVVGKTIKKLLPEEIVEADVESELIQSLDKFGFSQTKGHLSQAIDNHSQGNWAAANGQFRPFIESLLMEICGHLLPNNRCDSASAAISLLSSTINPPFFKTELNEIEHSKCDKPFIEGLWKRLHPAGTHPGPSDEDDCSFRYHTTIVFAHYILKRLADRKVSASNGKQK
jgi:hypothetical protein